MNKINYQDTLLQTHKKCLLQKNVQCKRVIKGTVIFPSSNECKIQWSKKSFENVEDFCHLTQLGRILSIHRGQHVDGKIWKSTIV